MIYAGSDGPFGMPSETASVSANVPKEVLERFDEGLDTGRDGSRSRSQQIEVAMRLWSAIGPKLEEAGYDIEDALAIQGVARDAFYRKLEAENRESGG